MKYQKLWRPIGKPGRAWWADALLTVIVVVLIITWLREAIDLVRMF